MKKLVFMVVVLCLTVPAWATLVYSPDVATLAGMSKTWVGGGATASEVTTSIIGSAVRFSAELKNGDGSGDGWASMGVGYGWQPPVGLNDLSAYTGYSLMFLNTNNSSWFVNLYVNTGWTDTPYNESDQFNQSGWVELAPGVSTTILVDFAAAGTNNLNHVTNIGFEVGGNMDTYPYSNTANPSNPDSYHIDVSSIPEPATLCLLGLGALSLLRRKR
jgi:hypothetical protein